MTTHNVLHCEDLYIKGETITSLTDDITSNVTTINALLLGLTGSQPIDDTTLEPYIQNRDPTSTDDINENWHIGNIWITTTQAFICINNAELNAILESVFFRN